MPRPIPPRWVRHTQTLKPTRPTVGRCRPELCGDLPHRHDRRHHCAGHHARLVAASRPRQRGRQRRRSLHHLLLRAQSRPVRTHHPRHRVACRAHALCGVALVARREGDFAQRVDRSQRRRPPAHHHAQRTGARVDQPVRRTRDENWMEENIDWNAIDCAFHLPPRAHHPPRGQPANACAI